MLCKNYQLILDLTTSKAIDSTSCLCGMSIPNGFTGMTLNKGGLQNHGGDPSLRSIPSTPTG